MKTPKVVWYKHVLCWVLKQKPEGILEVQIPHSNPQKLGWIIDLWPDEYQIVL
jgi:hypothetical protein